MRLSTSFELLFALLEVVDLNKVGCNLLLKQLHHLVVDALIVIELPLEVIDCLPQSIELIKLSISHLSLLETCRLLRLLLSLLLLTIVWLYGLELRQRAVLNCVDTHCDLAI